MGVIVERPRRRGNLARGRPRFSEKVNDDQPKATKVLTVQLKPGGFKRFFRAAATSGRLYESVKMFVAAKVEITKVSVTPPPCSSAKKPALLPQSKARREGWKEVKEGGISRSSASVRVFVDAFHGAFFNRRQDGDEIRRLWHLS